MIEALRTLAVEVLLVHTEQHYDAEMSDVFLGELGLPVPDVFLGVGSGSHAEQTSRALLGIEEVLLEHAPSLVVVVQPPRLADPSGATAAILRRDYRLLARVGGALVYRPRRGPA